MIGWRRCEASSGLCVSEGSGSLSPYVHVDFCVRHLMSHLWTEVWFRNRCRSLSAERKLPTVGSPYQHQQTSWLQIIQLIWD